MPKREQEIAIKEGRCEDENWIVRKDKSRFYANGLTTPIFCTDKKIAGFVKITRDFTEKRELEQRKDDFIHTASHEFKNPLTSMQAFIQILQKHLEKTNDEKAPSLVNKVQHQHDRLLALVNSLLDVAKITAGAIEFHKTTFSVGAWLKEIIEDLQTIVEQHTIILKNNIRVKVYADKEYLTQVIVNLIMNAIKYSPQANKMIVRVTKGKSTVTVSVQDFGIGISKKSQEKLFGCFFRVGGTRGRTIPGLGFGLFISKGIIERHNGTIWVKSEEGKGSTFSFSLLLKKSTFS
ncbi:MAG: Phosphate regulon sensor protein PhoR (SphS) [Candidatus Jettenia ecosi]|uniref:histidine kinase n=1 Tax=Candidatus Jettenia ecosi TaxID=2494326 RepID=A0A533Q6P2_9BACT|nr:MAG: Phosphate regulon sensor protein PhoR (SphS) [Candidatus Jettenia ecosi]